MGVPLRRADGTLVKAVGFVQVEQQSLADASPPDQWRGQSGKGAPVGSPGVQGLTHGGDLADTSGFGRAWWNSSIDIQRHARSGHTEQIRTDADLQLGPDPGRITRINDMRAGGLIGPDAMNSIPVDGNWGYMKHQQVGKLLTGSHATLRTIADDAQVPGIFAGNPLG